MTLEPMLRLIAGVFVLASLLLATFVHPGFLVLAAVVGVSLLQSSVTGWCPMMMILRRAGVRE